MLEWARDDRWICPESLPESVEKFILYIDYI